MSLDTYHQRALQLSRAMRLCQQELTGYASAVALLAVSAIAYNDAVLIKLKGERAKGQDHRHAIAAVSRACIGARIEPTGIKHLTKLLDARTDVSYGDKAVDNEIEPTGIKHLTKLLDAKTDVSYGVKAVDNEHALALSVLAERFQTWAERLLGGERLCQSLGKSRCC